MKTLALLILAIFLQIGTTFAQSTPRCGGICEGTSDNRFWNATCKGASVHGQRTCEGYGGIGCVWTPRRMMPGRCVGTSGNYNTDNVCKTVSIYGQRGCERYSGLGCMWEPAYCI